jgi:hypothetical protein
MTARAGKHRTIRLPEDLVALIDSVRRVPRERWCRLELRAACHRYRPGMVTITVPELVAGQLKRALVSGVLVDPSARLDLLAELVDVAAPPIDGLAVVVAGAGERGHVTPPTGAVAGRLEAERQARSGTPRLRLKRPQGPS